MFDNQCEQIAGSGKQADRLTGALIGLARATDGNEHLISRSSTAVIVEGLCATVADDNHDDAALERLLERVAKEKREMVPDCFTCACPCGKNDDYDMRQLWNATEGIRTLKSRILFGIRALATLADQAAELGCHDEEVDRFFYKALNIIGIEGWDEDYLLAVVHQAAQMKRKCMALLEKANAETASHPPVHPDYTGT